MFRSVNDELVYQTRVKPITSTPIFNAGTERFVRDWRTAHVTVAVKDSRMRENDAILGVVMLKVSISRDRTCHVLTLICTAVRSSCQCFANHTTILPRTRTGLWPNSSLTTVPPRRSQTATKPPRIRHWNPHDP